MSHNKRLLDYVLLVVATQYGDGQISMPENSRGAKIKKIKVNSSLIFFMDSISEVPKSIDECKSIKEIVALAIPRDGIGVPWLGSGESHLHGYVDSKTGKITAHETYEKAPKKSRHSSKMTADDAALRKMWDMITDVKEQKTISDVSKTYPNSKIMSYDPTVQQPTIKDQTLHFKLEPNKKCMSPKSFECSDRLFGVVVRKNTILAILVNQDKQIEEIAGIDSIKKSQDVLSFFVNTTKGSFSRPASS